MHESGRALYVYVRYLITTCSALHTQRFDDGQAFCELPHYELFGPELRA